MKEDTPDLTAIGLSTGARSLKVGKAAGDWHVFTEVNYAGDRGRVNQGLNYRNPQEMDLPRDKPVMSLKRADS